MNFNKESSLNQNSGTIMWAFTTLVFAVGIFMLGMYSERKMAMPKVTSVMCSSNNVLNGRRYIVDLTKPLFDQDCATHESFPDKILCQRMVTIECKLP